MLYFRPSGEGEAGFANLLLAVGVNAQGFRETLGIREKTDQGEDSWGVFLGELQKRGLTGVKLFVSSWSPPLRQAIAEVYPGAKYQNSVQQAGQKVLALVPNEQLPAVTEMMGSFARISDGRDSARGQVRQIIARLDQLELEDAAALLREMSAVLFNYYLFPPEHWRCLRTNEGLLHIARKVRERARVLGIAPDGKRATLMLGGYLRHIARSNWDRSRYLPVT